ncbi:MAG: enoyl-CoA hydratase/isomerase family protein [Sphingomonadales bacterium]|nr:enoyl-CoA hydratase/isomerase family protein [Sphingomonadales bacterium]
MFREVHYPSLDEIVAAAPEGMTKFRIELDDRGVALLTLNRPERLNAFSMGYPADKPRPSGWSMYDRYMRSLTQELKLDPVVRVVVFTGAGRAFSAGADIKDWAGTEVHAADVPSPFVKPGLLFDEHTAMMHIWLKHLIKPTIAMVNGPAVGMGADLASVCDIRMVSDTAFFQWAYVLNGIVPSDGALWLVQRLVGQGKALEWLITGNRVYPDEALRTGYANHVIPADALFEQTMEMARRIASIGSRTVQATRYAINCSATLGFQDSVGMAYLSNYATHEEARSAIVERAKSLGDRPAASGQ